MSWVRKGECNRCGDCCMSGDPFNGELGEGEIKGVCPLFKFVYEDGKKLGTCKVRTGEVSKDSHVYIKNYTTNACELWPSIPEHVAMYPNCSYSFEWVE